jgi:glutamate-5-semialdehyde dehydrogenase
MTPWLRVTTSPSLSNRASNMVATTQDIPSIARRAKQAATKLASSTLASRNQALSLIAHRLEQHKKDILEANKTDLELAQKLLLTGKLSEALLNRLKLDSAKLADLVAGIRQLKDADDPLGQVTLSRELDEGLNLYRVTCPIGVIGVIFESRPDAFPQITSLCIKSGNASILKGGSEAQNSNLKLFEIVNQALQECGLPPYTISLLESRKDVEEMLKADDLIDLIIPRGSNQLVRHIQNHTRIPVLGHAEGICHIYIDKDADFKKAFDITLDAKVQYPAACNSVETLLVHKHLADRLVPQLVDRLIQNKVAVRADKASQKLLGRSDVVEATTEDWQTEYSDLILSIKIVDSLEEAVDHINQYGSGHTDTIISENAAAAEQFFSSVNSAGVYVNASTRFADGFRYGFGAEVGISTGKLHPRGPVGVEGLVTYKYKLVGAGHVVRDYVGDDAKKFTHRKLL